MCSWWGMIQSEEGRVFEEAHIFQEPTVMRTSRSHPCRISSMHAKANGYVILLLKTCGKERNWEGHGFGGMLLWPMKNTLTWQLPGRRPHPGPWSKNITPAWKTFLLFTLVALWLQVELKDTFCPWEVQKLSKMPSRCCLDVFFNNWGYIS